MRRARQAEITTHINEWLTSPGLGRPNERVPLLCDRTRRAYLKLLCESDADATVWAKQLVDGHDIELWTGKRFVIQLKHQEK